MSEAAWILVFILSGALALFLILGIVLVVKLIGISNRIKDVAESVKNTTESIEGVAKNFAAVTSPVFVVKSIKDLFNKLKKKGEKNER